MFWRDYKFIKLVCVDLKSNDMYNVGEQEEKNEELDIKVFSCLRVQDIISLHHFQQKYFFKEKLQAS